MARIVHEAVTAQFHDDPPGFLARAPYGLYDVDAIIAALKAAGFRHVACESIACRGTCESAAAAATGICEGSPLRLEIEDRDPAGLARITSAAAEALRARFGDDLTQAKMRANLFTARAS